MSWYVLVFGVAMIKLGAFTYWYNMTVFDYPAEESVRSVIPAVDQFVICECRSQDNTLDIAKKLQSEFPDKIKIVRRNWVTHFTQIASVANFAMDALNDDIDFAYQIQADEVLHEDSIEELTSMPNMLTEAKKTAARVKYVHFMANYQTTFPFCYDTLVRIASRKHSWEIIGDGVQFAKHSAGRDDIPEEEVLNTEIQVFHYGKVKDAEKGWQKEHDFMELYRDIGFPDPKVAEMEAKLGKKFCDYIYLFEDHVKNGTIKKFTGVHPFVMKDRIAAFKAGGYEQFVSEMEANVKIAFKDNNV